MATLNINDTDYVASTTSPVVAADNIVLVVTDGGVAPFTLAATDQLKISKVVGVTTTDLATGIVPNGANWTVTIQVIIKQIPPQ